MSTATTVSTGLFLGPFIVMIISLALIVFGFIVLYFIIRAAINNSRLNQQIDLLRRDIAILNDRITSLTTSAKKSEEFRE